MQPQILQTMLTPSRVIAAGVATDQVDLVVNPISHILFTLRAVNAVAAGAAYTALSEMLAKITNINVKYRGASIFNGTLADMLVLNMLRKMNAWGSSQLSNVNADIRTLTIPLSFGRALYNPDECFPATRRGDLILQWTSAADGANITTFTAEISTVELLDATPKRFVKTVQTQQAMAGVGLNDINLPVGNKILGVLMKPFTFPTGAALTSSFGKTTLRVDGVEMGYVAIGWNTMHGALSRRIPPWWTDVEHIHGFVDAAAGQVNTQQGTRIFTLPRQYGYLELDPNDDTTYALDTRGAALIQLREDSDVADAANLSSVYPIELVELAQGAIGG